MTLSHFQSKQSRPARNFNDIGLFANAFDVQLYNQHLANESNLLSSKQGVLSKFRCRDANGGLERMKSVIMFVLYYDMGTGMVYEEKSTFYVAETGREPSN